MCLRKKFGTLDSYVADTYTTVFKILDSGDKSLCRGARCVDQGNVYRRARWDVQEPSGQQADVPV